jgi:signal transduction histidine kinase
MGPDQPEDQPGGAITITPANPEDVIPRLKGVPTLSHLRLEDFGCLAGAEWVEAPAGVSLYAAGVPSTHFWILLQGELRAWKSDTEGERMLLMTLAPGETFGEVPLLLGKRSAMAHCEVISDCSLVRLPEAGFWNLMAGCPTARAAILDDMSRRFELYQAVTLHREKLISLGTLAAGLMHELNNPGAAARRAASQLRENMTRLQAISLRMTRSNLSAEQLECVASLQEEVFQLRRPAALNSLEQSDREEELSEWLEGIEVENAWRLAPTMVSAGLDRDELECARHNFEAQSFSDILNYLDALISSIQLVGTVEESIGRVTDLVTAVKKYAYNDKGREQAIDVAESLHNTLTILGHKFRNKQLTIDRDFAPGLPTIKSQGGGLTQVWTNILDNAIDAAPQKGHIGVRVWMEGESICVGIADDGPGIPKEHWDHIYEPFFTTKEAGVGTGLGLDIAHRIIASHFNGQISFTTAPGRTEFIVRLPVPSS